MARIAGVDIPKHKRGVIALTYIYGVGKSRAQEILTTAKVDENIKVQDWNDDQISGIREAIAAYTIEGELRVKKKQKTRNTRWYKHPTQKKQHERKKKKLKRSESTRL
eukprot:TRINITY_DN8638_c1_g1_i1.p1 TRINITY_DN8638_c1_g1~~TRINITY_DN8638_c1_g1_i1.p1  ORF type:complete len:108 (+),score=12.41 TRINITY_DN8638_c1_g1_i1:96-419(+)